MAEEDSPTIACSHCGHTISAQARFCRRCGNTARSPMPSVCSCCGVVVEASDRYCAGCGTELGPSAPDATTQPRTRTAIEPAHSNRVAGLVIWLLVIGAGFYIYGHRTNIAQVLSSWNQGSQTALSGVDLAVVKVEQNPSGITLTGEIKNSGERDVPCSGERIVLIDSKGSMHRPISVICDFDIVAAGTSVPFVGGWISSSGIPAGMYTLRYASGEGYIDQKFQIAAISHSGGSSTSILTPKPQVVSKPSSNQTTPPDTPTNADLTRITAIRGWLNSQRVVQCFPGIVPSQMFEYGTETTNPRASLPPNELPRNSAYQDAIPERHPVDPFKSRDVVSGGKAAALSDPNPYSLYAFWNVEKAAIIEGDCCEGMSTIEISSAAMAPAFVHTEPITISLKSGLTLGSTRQDVENFFHYGLDKAPVVSKACGLVAEHFISPDSSPFYEFMFVFRNDSVVALAYSYGS